MDNPTSDNFTEVVTANHSMGMPLTSGQYMFMGTYLLFIGLGATLFNAATLIMFARNKKLRNKPHNMLLINLAVADIGISVFGYPLTMASCFAERWLWGTVGCYVQGFMTFTLALCSMYTMTAISVYRYFALCKPQHNHLLSKERTQKLIVGLWVGSIIIPAMPLFGWTQYTFEPYLTACSIDWTSTKTDNIAFIILCIVLCYVTTVGIMVFSYYKMVLKLHKLHRTISHARTQVITLTEAESMHKMASEARVTWISLFMVFTFTLIWSPYAWMGLWACLVGGVSVGMSSIPSMLAKATCFINPVMYIFISPDFRRNLTACFKRNLRVHDVHRGSVNATATSNPIPTITKRRNNNVFKVDRTNDGIFIGSQTVHFHRSEASMF